MHSAENKPSKSGFKRVVQGLGSLALALCLGGGAARADLLAFYPMNGDVNDASGHGLNGGIEGSASFVSNGPFGGQAIEFTGTSNGFVTSPVNLDWNVNPEITFGAWVNASSLSATSDEIRGIISGDQGGYGRTIDVDTRNGGLQWSAFTGAGVAGNGIVAANQWTFLAVRYDQAAGTFTFNVNGSQISGTTDFNVPTTGTTIGRNPTFDNPFSGEISDAFFFNSVLTDSQISAIQANGPTAILKLPLATPEPDSAVLLALGGLVVFAGVKRNTFKTRLARRS